MQTAQYSRKPFTVNAVQVTSENMAEVAAWCQGQVRATQSRGSSPAIGYVSVPVNRPLNERQTRAFVNDWVLEADTGFKVYTPRAFENSFEKTSGEGLQELRTVGVGDFAGFHEVHQVQVAPPDDEYLDGSSMDMECGH